MPFPARFIFFLVVINLITFVPGFSQDPIHLQDTSVTYRLDPRVEVFIDDTEKIPAADIVSGNYDQRFSRNKGNLTFGYLKSIIWIKATIQTDPGTHWYLEIPAPFLEYVDFYETSDGKNWIHSSGGYYRPQSGRTISHTGHVIELHPGPNAFTTVYIQIAGRSPKTFPLYAITKDRFAEKVRLEDIGYGIFFGILGAMFFYNLFIYLTIRESNYLLYICTIVCTFLVFSSASGYAGKFIWPEHPSMNFYAGRLILGALAIFMSLFTIRFLSVRMYSKVMYYALLSLIPLGVLACFLVATGILSSAGNNLITVATIIFMTTGIVCRLNGNRTATYFITAWSIYLTGGALLTLRNSGFFNFTLWTTHFVEIGAALETMIIAFALGDQYRQLRREKDEAQLLALKLQRGATGRLEIMVRERTEDLSRTNTELQSALETNRKQTRMIQDKNAELDAFFYRISHDLRGPISSMLGLSMLAKMEVNDEKALSYLDKQHGQIERLNHIITSLINLTHLNQDHLPRQQIDFDKLIDDCIESFNGVSNYEKISFRKAVEPDIRFYSVWALLNAIVQNLIENAIKYAQPDSPYVQINVFTKADTLIIEVEDNGQGIPNEYQGRIFEMFFRATQNASGTGLGLYILKRSVDQLKGTIEFKSTVGEGSTFTVRLPIPPETVS